MKVSAKTRHRLVESLTPLLSEKAMGDYAANVLQSVVRNDGGPGSGNFGHEGRPGEIGGSAPGDEGSKPKKITKKQYNSQLESIADSSGEYDERHAKIKKLLNDMPVGSKVQTPAHWNDNGKADILVWDGNRWGTKKGWDYGGWSTDTDELAHYFMSEYKEERPVVCSVAMTEEAKQKDREQFEKTNWRGNEQIWQKGGSLSQKTELKLRKQDIDSCGVGTVVTGSDGRQYIKDYDGFEKAPDGQTDITKYAWRDVETYRKADMRVLKSPKFEGDFFSVNFGLNGVSDVECANARSIYDQMPEEMRPHYEKTFREGRFVASVPTYNNPEPGSFYSTSDRNVHFGKTASADTIFHECTHAFDRGALNVEVDLPGFGKYNIRNASEYLDHLAGSTEDHKKDFEAMAKVFGFKTDGDGWFSEEYGDTEDINTCFKLHKVFSKGANEYKGIRGFECVADAVSALTQDRCLCSIFDGGHETSYWRQPYGGGNASNRSKEYWANYCVLRITGSNEALSLLKEITPTMYDAAEKAYAEVFRNGKK